MSEEHFEVGQTVFSRENGNGYTIRRISAAGLLAFGAPPYNNGSYVSPYWFTGDRLSAVTRALGMEKQALSHYQRTLVETKKLIEETEAAIIRLTAAVAFEENL